MYKNLKLSVYQGIIQYLLDNTDYNLKKIASFSHCSIKAIRSIYTYGEIPPDFSTELYLIRLFQIIIELEHKYGKQKSRFPHKNGFRVIALSGVSSCNQAV